MLRRLGRSEFLRVVLLMRYWLIVYIVTTVLMAVITVLCLNLVMAFILKDVLNAAVQHDISLVQRALWMALVAFFIGEPLLALLGYINNWCIIKTITQVRKALFDKMTRLPVNHFEKTHSGDLLTRLTCNIDSIGNIYQGDLVSLVYGLAYTGLALVFIFTMEWRMGLFIVAVNMFSVLIGMAFRKPIRQVANHVQAEQAVLTERFLDLAQGIAVTKMFNIESVIWKRYTEKNDELSSARIRQAGLNAFAGLAGNLHWALKNLGILIVGLFLVMRHQVDLGSIGAIIFMQGYAGIFFENLGQFIPRMQESLAGASRVLALFDWPLEGGGFLMQARQLGTGKNLAADPLDKVTDKLLEIKGLTFGYEENDAAAMPVLNGLDLAVERGQIVALVGPSGSGKSTILKLLMGFYPVHEGDILIEGKRMSEYSLGQLRSLFAYVPQDVYLFDGTIQENISYGKVGASREEIIQAAQLAHAHDFIMEQAEGYETLVGENGAKLSGGQKQRIAIARALLKNAPILLLDEATSALDSESEQIVQKALDVLMEGRTTIAIAHRLSTIQHATVIGVLSSGKIVEQGNHNDLMSKGGLYSRLYDLQFKTSDAVLESSAVNCA